MPQWLRLLGSCNNFWFWRIRSGPSLTYPRAGKRKKSTQRRAIPFLTVTIARHREGFARAHFGEVELRDSPRSPRGLHISRVWTWKRSEDKTRPRPSQPSSKAPALGVPQVHSNPFPQGDDDMIFLNEWGVGQRIFLVCKIDKDFDWAQKKGKINDVCVETEVLTFDLRNFFFSCVVKFVQRPLSFSFLRPHSYAMTNGRRRVLFNLISNEEKSAGGREAKSRFSLIEGDSLHVGREWGQGQASVLCPLLLLLLKLDTVKSKPTGVFFLKSSSSVRGKFFRSKPADSAFYGSSQNSFII